MMTYPETVDYLYSKLPVYQKQGSKAYKPGLANITALSAAMGNPHQGFKSIHIAGTNGKGSISHALAAMLQTAGYKTGLYTSPHLKDLNERIRINGNPMSHDKVVEFVAQHKEVIEQVNPSFFELTVAMAFYHFAKEGIDVAVVETGMGGTNDSTNIITPQLSIITNIGYDHQSLLGPTLEHIAQAKAGIIKQGVPVVVSERQPEIEHVFRNRASEVGAPLFWAEQRWRLKERDDSTYQLLRADVYRDGQLYDENIALDLAGNYQLRNMAGVLRALDVLRLKGWNIRPTHMREAMAHVGQLTGLRGRWQVIQEEPVVVADTGHNEEGIRQVLHQLKRVPYKKLHWVLGMVEDKAIDRVLEQLPSEALYYFCAPNVPRALTPEALAQAAQRFGLKGLKYSSVEVAYSKAMHNAAVEDCIMVGGSTFVVAEVL